VAHAGAVGARIRRQVLHRWLARRESEGFPPGGGRVECAAHQVPSSPPAQYVITANTGNTRLTAFSPVDGSVAILNVFPLVNTAQVSAIDVNGEIWISEQTGDRITRRDLAGNILGVIGPTFAGGGFDNIRGMAYIGGLVYVTNAGTANGAPGANAIVVLDSAGTWQFNIITTGTSNSPFGVMPFQGDMLVSGSSTLNDVHRYTLAGASVGLFHNSTSISFAHQLAPASDGNVWVGCFTTGGITKLNASTGAVMSSFPASGCRGVFELLNGNILWTSSTGAHVYNVTTATSTTVVSGSCYHLNLFNVSSATALPYGTGCDGLGLAPVGLPSVGNLAFSLDVTTCRSCRRSPSSPSARCRSPAASTSRTMAWRAASATRRSTSTSSFPGPSSAASATSRCRSPRR